ncbi:unnamed protein product [Phytomonas sp. Hart1]|nr:unnamed protein product [Phytomonas sp. Hart1]|eukprot:CCW66076.1 unnamed protein product [Phytomonas sp. isolate Hart1]
MTQEDKTKMLSTGLYERTHILVGDNGVEALRRACVLVVGVGGVGGICAEALARAGIGSITLVDPDTVVTSNKNRQIVALDSTVGCAKVDVLAARLRDINPDAHISPRRIRLLKDGDTEGEEGDGNEKEEGEKYSLFESAEALLQSDKPYDAVIDCIDSVGPKVALLAAAAGRGIRVFASGGAGGRLDPSRAGLRDIFDTANDGLLRACRAALRRRGIGPGVITVVSSLEKGLPPLNPPPRADGAVDPRRKAVNGTISYMPPLFGLILASAVIRYLLDPQAAKENKAKEAKKRKREATKKNRALRHLKGKKELPKDTS